MKFFSSVLLYPTYFIIFHAILILSQAAHCTNRANRLPHSPFPVSATPENVWVYNITNLNFDERVLAMSLSGIVAQKCPEIFLLDLNDDWSQKHLDLLPITPKFDYADNFVGLADMFKEQLNGYTICTSAAPDIPATDNGPMHIAISLAGIKKTLVITEKTKHYAESLKLGQLFDARTMQINDVFTKFSAEFSKRILYNQDHSNLHYTTDYAIYAKAWAQYDNTLTMPLSDNAFSILEPMSVVFGWAHEVEFNAAASRRGHFVLCSDRVTNLPLYSNFEIEMDTSMKPHGISAEEPNVSLDEKKHTVAFMFTDGDSLTWDLGTFASASHDWWGSSKRGNIPIAWTFQPVLYELHPYFLDYVKTSATPNDILIAGPSGGGYTYIDQYPNIASRDLFANWTATLMQLTNMKMINMISVNYHGPELEEIVNGISPPEAIFLDEYFHLTISGKVKLQNSTLVTGRRYALSKTFGIGPDALIANLNKQSTDSKSEDGYSIVGIEVWGYGMSDILYVINNLDSSKVQVVNIQQYVELVKKNVFNQ